MKHQVSTSDNLTGPPPPSLPVPRLVAPVNTEVSLPFQLMKAAVPAERYNLVIIFHRHLCTPAMSLNISQVDVALFPTF